MFSETNLETTIKRGIVRAALIAAALLPVSASAQLDDKCVVAILNRTAQVTADGSWVVPNVPANMGRVRARATCVRDGVTTVGQSAFFDVPRNGVINDIEIAFGTAAQTPSRLEVSATRTSLPNIGDTEQLRVMALFPSDPSVDVSAEPGTSYTTSNPVVATISAGGLITGVGPGVAIISASYDGTLALFRIAVGGAVDTDGDGMPDDYERQFNFDPNNPADAAADADSDGLTNLQEFQLGTGPRTVDTDGDGISDGLEVQNGTDPLNAGSYNLSAALRSVVVSPTTVELRGNPLFGDISRQLTVTGNLLDGRTINLTAHRDIDYTSSNLLVCNFGTTAGQLFAGQNGTATVTVAVGGFTIVVPVSVTAFTPVGISKIDIPGYANNVEVLDGFAYVAAGSAGLQVVNISNRSAPQIVANMWTNGNAYDLRIAGHRLYIADGYAGLEIVDITDPFDPFEIGTIDTIGTAQDVWVDGNYAYIADGAAGLQIIDVTDPEHPRRLARVQIPGVAKGVSVSGGYAVVATGDSSNALVVVDVRDPVQPVIAGSVSLLGEPKDVVARGTLAYVAAYSRGMYIVDFSTPTAPQVIGSSGQVLAPRDVVLLGNTAVFGEQLFPHAVPFIDVTDPANPAFRGIIDLTLLGDYAETGIAIDSAYVYTTAEYYFVGRDYADIGRTALFIGQYAPVDDPASVFPTATITSPLDGTEVVAGTTLPITVNATDDERVASVSLYADGTQIYTTRTPPFTTELQVPQGVSSITLSAVAFDFGNRSGTSSVVVRVIPDPGTTITGIVLGPGGVPQPGVRVELVDYDVTGFTDGNGRYTFTGMSSIDGAYEIYADVEIAPDVYDGRIKAVLPVRGGITNVPDLVLEKITPVVEMYAPPYGDTLIGGTTVSLMASATSRLYGIASMSITVDGVVVGTSSGDFVNVSFPVPNVPGTLRIGATATDFRGHIGTAEEIIVSIQADPMTTVQGTVVNASGNPVAGARVTVLGAAATTGADGRYVINNVSTVVGDLFANASAFIGGDELFGVSEEWPPVPGGITWLDVTVRAFPVGKIAEVALGGYGNAVDAQGTRLYIAGGMSPGSNNLQIVDVANPAAPQFIGGLVFMTLVTDVKVAGTIAYVSAGYLYTVDVSSPNAPVILGSLPTVATTKLQLAGHVIIALGADGLTTIDVSNPAAPRVLGKLGSFKLAPRAIALTGTRAIVTEYSQTFLGSSTLGTDVHVIELNNPAAPVRLGRVTISTTGRIHDVAVRGTRAYLAMTNGSSNTSGIPMIDFSNPAAPVLSGTYTQANLMPFAIAAQSDLLLVGGGSTSSSTSTERLQVLNAAVNPPQQVTGLDPAGGANTAVAVSGSFAYALAGGNSTVELGACCVENVITARYRATNDQAGVKPTISFTRPQPGDVMVEGGLIPIQVTATDDVAVSSVTINVNGTKLQTISGASARALYRIPNGQTSLSIVVTATDFGGNTGDSTLSFQVATDPRTTVTGRVRTSGGTPVPATVRIGALNTTADAAGFYSLANVPTTENVVVTVAGTLNGEELRATSAPIAPVAGGVTNVPDVIAAPRPNGPISSIAAPGHIRAAAVRGKIAFVVNGSSTHFRSYIQAIDFSDIEAPRVIGNLFMFETPFGIAVSGNYAYVATANNGIVIVNVSDPANMQRVRFFGFGNGTDMVTVVGTTLYSGTRNGTVFVIDVSDPNNPVVLSSVKTSDTANSIAVSGRYVLTAGGRGNNNEGGFNVTDVIDPRKATFLSTMPPLVPTLGYASFGSSVIARGNMAWVASPGTTGGSLHKIDFSTASAPTILNTYTGMAPVKVAVNGNTLVAVGRALTTDGSQGSGILGVFDATASSFTPTIHNVANTGSYFPENLTLAGDTALVMASILGAHDNRTFFTKYPTTVDRAGVPPVVTINSPLTGDRVTQGDQVPVLVTANDDIGVASVSITANGAGVGRLTAPPYSGVMNVPAGVSTVTVSATATDLNGNVGQSGDVVLQVQTDPGTTVNGHVVESGGASVANATVKLRGQQTTTDAVGAYAFANVPTVPGTLVAEAFGRVSNNALGVGTSSPTPANPGGFTTIPNISLQVPPLGPIKSFPLSLPANGVTLNRSLGVVSMGGSGLLLLDMTNPYQAAVLSTIALRSNSIAREVKLSGNFAYVAAGQFTGMNIVDLTNPALPLLRGNVLTSGDARRLAVSGTTVYVTDFAASGGLKVIDASNPDAPAIVGSLVMNRWMIDVEVSGSRVVLLHSSSSAGNVDPRLSIIDVSNPASPLLLGSIATPGATVAGGLVVRGTTAFVAGGREVQMFDFSNPAVPTLVGRFSQTAVTANAVADAGTHLLQVGVISSPHQIEIINTTAFPTLSLGGTLAFPNVTAFAGVDVAVSDEFVMSSGQSGWPLQFGVSRVYIGKWRN